MIVRRARRDDALGSGRETPEGESLPPSYSEAFGEFTECGPVLMKGKSKSMFLYKVSSRS